ncbi:hypothetical protein ACW4YW_11435 [Methylobacillus pratensis]
MDKDSSNDAEDNLAFLCLDCHDRYDSKTSQSKNFTIGEVKGFRAELDTALDSAFSKDVRFGEAVAAATEGINGQYIRVDGGSSSAELTVRQLPNGDIRVIGEALWGANREHGPNIGTLDFLADLDGNVAIFEDHLLGDDRPYRACLIFANELLEVDEDNPGGYFGMNVSFAGTYVKAT